MSTVSEHTEPPGTWFQENCLLKISSESRQGHHDLLATPGSSSVIRLGGVLSDKPRNSESWTPKPNQTPPWIWLPLSPPGGETWEGSRRRRRAQPIGAAKRESDSPPVMGWLSWQLRLVKPSSSAHNGLYCDRAAMSLCWWGGLVSD